jgi:hypothetical protein
VVAQPEGFKFDRRDLIRSRQDRQHRSAAEVGSVQETVTVSAESPVVDVTSKEVGGNITSRELIDLPSINRNYIGFVGLLPGIVANISTESFGSDAISVNGQDQRNSNQRSRWCQATTTMPVGQRREPGAHASRSIQEFRSSRTSSTPSSAGRPAP